MMIRISRRKSIHGIPVLGTRKDIPRLVKKYDVAEVVMPFPRRAAT